MSAVRKGVYSGLEAWLKSPAHRDETFMLERMRSNVLRAAPNYTWNAAGVVLLNAYREALANTSPVNVQKSLLCAGLMLEGDLASRRH